MDYSDLPKIELHLHLDCSLSYEVVQKLDQPITEKEYKNTFIAPDKCKSLADYISRSQRPIELMQTHEALELVVEDLFRQLKADNVIYAEMRFAPLEHTRIDLSPEEVVETVNRATAMEVNKTGIEAGIILCTLRHYSEQQSMNTAKLAEQFKDTRVVGFDIAGDEAGYPIDNHISAFQYANEHNINCTAHAGEARGAESVWDTLNEFEPSRIGHGVRSIEDPELMEFLKEKNIHLEVCPTSNIQTDVFEEITDHPVDRLFRSKISLSINTDGRTVSDVTLGDEYQTLERVFDWNQDQLKQCNLEAIKHAFTSDVIKDRLRRQIEKAYEEK